LVPDPKRRYKASGISCSSHRPGEAQDDPDKPGKNDRASVGLAV